MQILRPKVLIYSFVLTLLSSCSGIQLPGSNGEVHHLIIGIGVVSVNDPDGEKIASVVKSNALGINSNIGPNGHMGVSAGLSSKTSFAIKDGVSDTCAEVRGAIFSEIVVETCPSTNLANF